jgi:hypothetical protein
MFGRLFIFLRSRADGVGLKLGWYRARDALGRRMLERLVLFFVRGPIAAWNTGWSSLRRALNVSRYGNVWASIYFFFLRRGR